MDNFHGRRSGNSSPNVYREKTWRTKANEEDRPSSSMYNNKRENESYQPKFNKGNGQPFRISRIQEHRPDHGRFGSRQPRSMGYTFLDDLVRNDAEKIILTLVKERKGFTDLLEKELNPDVVVLIVKILTKVSSSAFSDTKYSILHSSFNDKFVAQLNKFIACLPLAQKRPNSHFWREPNEFWANLLEICEDLLHTTPTFACKTFPAILNSLKIYIPVIEDQHNIQLSKDIKDKAARLQDMMKIFVKEKEEKQKCSEEAAAAESLDPPDDFRQISVYPSAEEIVGGRGFLRQNVVEGPYQNVNHYLDVQFRLLREDFVGPLRDGIANYRASQPLNDNIKIHKAVQFLNSETINEFYCLRVQFASKKKKGLSFQNSKRFMFGSLLCFTQDNFQTLFFGKVAQRKMEDLTKGQVIVAFDKRLTVDYNSTYLMVECSVYFEPYFHVLTVLKNMTEENFPMERYIVRVNPSVQPPEYLTAPDCTYEIEGHEFNPLLEWPNDNFYSLNESQMVAFKAAITQEIAVIQGPPGTGKTYMGLKIAETLLKNKDLWYDFSPMLVICYTNHALDQFLEGLLPVTTSLIRVGGQSKNPRLEPYNLRNKSERDATVSIKRRELQDCLRNIKVTAENLQQIEYFNSVVSFYNFAEVIPDYEDTWFATAKQDDIIKWLLEETHHGQRRTHNNLEAMQVWNEFNRIGINDEVNNDVYSENSADDASFNNHIISKFDSIFEEVFDYLPQVKRSFFLITLNSMREQMREYETTLVQLMQIDNPTFHELIREEQTRIYLDELHRTFEYVKARLSEGRYLQGRIRQPDNVDLRRPHTIPFESRWHLYFYWLSLYRQREADVLKMTCEDFPTLCKEYEELRQIEDVRTMRDAQVIGMTTTSAARLRSSLQTLKSPIVIVEEAAEVLEAHIVTSVTKHCKHLILIGDHKQLRPSTANYNLEKQYRLGISLFERMIINKLHCYTLNVQHRMRPEIACLIRPAIYDFLEDHPSVLQRPVITGIDNCLFFIDHDNLEEPYEGSSKINLHEVRFLIYLARHLVLNGYNPENITILAAYLGQFFEFKNMIKAHLDLLDGVKIVVLDNYQGEESDIILLSLVRNNEDNKIGFLSIENRVCVALSRARNAMYIMGNMAQLSSENKLWGKIKTSLERQNALGQALPLRCQIHQDQITLVKCDTDFFSVSEGGCSKKCDMDLKCGHKCTYLCHIRDRTHMFYKCQTQCNKPLCSKDETHICKKMCFEDCGLCTYLVERTLPCGHEVNIPCHVDPETYKCQVKVPTELPCGHKTDKPCSYDPQTFRCPHICDVQVQPCGHSCELLCHIRTDPDHLEYRCKKPCTKFMKDCSIESEEHRCKKQCWQECDTCTVTVRKRRTLCPHFYDVPCKSDVDELVCEKPCTKILKCGHPCKAKCNEPCRECQLKVFKENAICGHQVKVRCCEAPSRKYCNRQCPLKLPCGHLCTKKCNEPCTEKCTEIVDCDGIEAECGHLVTRTECHMTTSCVDPKLLVRYCKEPCREILKCGHSCSGSCGECSQGRVHKRCSEKCGTLLVCDHKCEFPCRQACRPCKKVCEYRCQHSACKKFCGEICTPCRERCPRRCKHQWCNKFCGEICSVPPCTEPCQKLLKCGHQCVGFCGDQCPPKCMVCDREELLEIFLGYESEDARYVYLSDCKHIVEHTGLEQWLLLNENQISYKVCPKCKTAIRTTQRYSDYIKRAIQDVAAVKFKTNGRLEDITEIRKDMQYVLRKLEQQSGNLVMYCQPIHVLLQGIKTRIQTTKKGRHPNINIHEARSLKAKLQLIELVVNICCDKTVSIATPREIFFPQVNFIVRVLSRDVDYITNQEIEDVTLEISRLARIVDYSCIQKVPQFAYSKNNEEGKDLIASVEKQLFESKRFSKKRNDLLKALLTELNDVLKSGLAISEEERIQIVEAMRFSKGHWFKCPNGHIYAIGECGGAMQEAQCYECGAKIGGSNHQLLNDNAVATEMDGATYSAYSERANLMNYDLEYIRNLEN